MDCKFEDEKKRRKSGLLERIFPVEYDFEQMLGWQANQTRAGVEAFLDWLEHHPDEEPVEMDRLESRVDDMRYDLEEKLKDAFSTPFDRQDIYGLSRQMDYILNYASETAREMYVFSVLPDRTILGMTKALIRGTALVCEGVHEMSGSQRRTKEIIREAREVMHEIEGFYINGMDELFRTGDPMAAMKKREVYHHLRDAGRALRGTVDALHKAVVGIDLAGE
jgi:Phosphate transport regulator (distant homolog of PhoU)